MKFADSVRETTIKYLEQIRAANENIKKFEKEGKEYYSETYFNQKLDELKKAKQDIIDLAKGEIVAIVTDYKAKIANMDVLDGANVTPDIALLDGKRKITQRDLESMFDRATGNRTMQRIIMDYSQDYDLPISRALFSVQLKEQGADNLKNYAISALTSEWGAAFLETDSYFEKIVSEAIRED